MIELKFNFIVYIPLLFLVLGFAAAGSSLIVVAATVGSGGSLLFSTKTAFQCVILPPFPLNGTTTLAPFTSSVASYNSSNTSASSQTSFPSYLFDLFPSNLTT